MINIFLYVVLQFTILVKSSVKFDFVSSFSVFDESLPLVDRIHEVLWGQKDRKIFRRFP